MYTIYIDHPATLDSYHFIPGDKTGEDVVSRILGMKATFVCNTFAKISKGDVYEIQFENHEDATAFILKSECKLVDKNKVEEYQRSRKR